MHRGPASFVGHFIPPPDTWQSTSFSAVSLVVRGFVAALAELPAAVTRQGLVVAALAGRGSSSSKSWVLAREDCTCSETTINSQTASLRFCRTDGLMNREKC